MKDEEKVEKKTIAIRLEVDVINRLDELCNGKPRNYIITQMITENEKVDVKEIIFYKSQCNHLLYLLGEANEMMERMIEKLYDTEEYKELKKEGE